MRCDQRSRGRRRLSARESDTSIRARPSRVLIDSSIGGAPCFNARVTSSDTTLWASFRTVRRQSRSHLDTAWRAMPGAVASAGSCNFQVMTLPFHESRCRRPTQRPPRPVALQAARSATRRGQMGSARRGAARVGGQPGCAEPSEQPRASRFPSLVQRLPWPPTGSPPIRRQEHRKPGAVGGLTSDHLGGRRSNRAVRRRVCPATVPRRPRCEYRTRDQGRPQPPSEESSSHGTRTVRRLP